MSILSDLTGHRSREVCSEVHDLTIPGMYKGSTKQ